MYNAKYFKTSISEMQTLATKNKVDLRAITNRETKTIIRYEIYVEDCFWMRYHDEKTARKMWKDFAAA